MHASEDTPGWTAPPADDELTEKIEGYEEPTPGGWEDYPIDELAIRDERRTAEDVVRRIGKGRFVLDPDFQRGFVWKPEQQSRLIESILMRIPLPVFYVAEDSEGRLIAVDGRQRLTTIDKFLRGGLKLALPDRGELNGKRFSDLEPRLQNRVEDCQLLFYIIDHSVPERARLDIFERVNSGAPLTRQQMRNAIYNGPATTFLREESNTDLFIKATGKSLNIKKMQDREFVNRFCSFLLVPLEDYKGDMDKWLAEGLKRLNRATEAELADIRDKFRLTLRNNWSTFGKHAFRKHLQMDQGRSVVNASLFDVMSTGLSRYDEDTVKAHAAPLREAFYTRMGNDEFIKAITYGPNTPKEVRKRFEIATQMFNEVFDAP